MKLRVLEVLASLRRAGAERIAVSLACRLDPAGFETGVVSLYDALPDGFEPVLAERGVPMWHLGKHRGFDPRMWPRLARAFRDFRPDIVHTHSYVMRYALPVRVGTLVHTVHNLARKEVDAIGRMVHRIAFRLGAVPVAISQEMARSFRDVYGFEPAAVIPNGIDACCGFRPGARKAWREANGFEAGDFLIVSAARLAPQKNPLGLIDAFARAFGDSGRCHLILAGGGAQLEECRARAEELNAAGRVHFLGVCRDLSEVLSACDVFALASLWEGSPLAVMEAMAARLPVIATAVGGVPELVDDGVTGVLVPPGDSEALATALAALAGDPSRRRAMSEAAAQRALRFDAAAMADSYAALFERIARRTK